MGLTQWLLIIGIVCVVAFVVLRPNRWGRGDRGNDSSGGVYVHDSRRRDDDDHHDGDGGDGGGDGGGGD
jgi:hypothetical protein